MLIILILLSGLFGFAACLQAGKALPAAIWQTPDGSPFMLMNQEDDSDIKIAGEEKKAPVDDSLKEAEELRKQKENGNLERARRLGQLLSKDIIRLDGESSFGEDEEESCEVRMQRRLLLAFAACYGVDVFVENKMVGKVAVNSFYDTLKKSLPAFYDDLSGSGAFSFYYLSVRRGGNVEKNIGKTFAMLSGKEDDSVLSELGEALFIRFTDVIEKTIESVNFVK